MEDLVIRAFNPNNLFDADAFLDNDGDLRLRLVYLDENENHKVITTGKIEIQDMNFIMGDQSEIEVNLSITPDKLNNLYTVETYE